LTRTPLGLDSAAQARVIASTDVAVIAGAGAIAVGAPVADPLIGLAITAVILRITWRSWLTVRGGDTSPDRRVPV